MANMQTEKRQSKNVLRKKFAAFEAAVNREIEKMFENKKMSRRWRRESPPKFATHREDRDDILRYCTDNEKRVAETAYKQIEKINKKIKSRHQKVVSRLNRIEKNAIGVIKKARKKLQADEFALDVSVTLPDEVAEIRATAGVTYDSLLGELKKIGLDPIQIKKAMPAI